MFVLAAFNKMAPSTGIKSELKPSGKTACSIECNLIYFQSTASIDSIPCAPWDKRLTLIPWKPMLYYMT